MNCIRIRAGESCTEIISVEEAFSGIRQQYRRADVVVPAGRQVLDVAGIQLDCQPGREEKAYQPITLLYQYTYTATTRSSGQEFKEHTIVVPGFC